MRYHEIWCLKYSYEISHDIYTRENDEKWVAHKMVSKFKAHLTRNLYAFFFIPVKKKKTKTRKNILDNENKSWFCTCRDIAFKRYQLKIGANLIIYSGIIGINIVNESM